RRSSGFSSLLIFWRMKISMIGAEIEPYEEFRIGEEVGPVSPGWATSLRAVAQAIAGALPALLLVIFAGLLALLALACGPGRRAFALDYADRLTDLATVVVGRSDRLPPEGRSPADPPG